MKHTIVCIDFRPCRRNTLLGFATVRISEMRLIVRDIAVHEKGASRWAQLPAKPMIKDGAAVFKDGKAQYATIMEFDDRTTREAFSRAVVSAVLAAAPHAFDEKGAAA
jgi:hypothetical protein